MQDRLDQELRKLKDSDAFVRAIRATIETLASEPYEKPVSPKDVRQQLKQLSKALERLSGNAQLHIFKSVPEEIRDVDWLDAVNQACKKPFEPVGTARDPVRVMMVRLLSAHAKKFGLKTKKTKGGDVSRLVRLVIEEANLFRFGEDGDKITEEICDFVKSHP